MANVLLHVTHFAHIPKESSEQAKYVLICFTNQVSLYFNFAITDKKHEFSYDTETRNYTK